jgi:urea carboxylase-associated protein 1
MVGVPEAGSAAPPGRVVRDDVVPAGEGWSDVVRQGQILRIVDQAGKQGVDFLCYHAANHEERYHAANTLKKARSIWLTTGHVLYSDVARPMFTIVGDTCGRHDTIGGCCSAPSNFMMYGVTEVPGCRETFLRLLGRYGMGRRDIVANFNFFSNVPVGADGRLADTVFVEGLSKPGDFVDLRAEMDALALVANCPQVNNPCAGLDPTPVRVVIWEPSRGESGSPPFQEAGLRT